MRLSPRAFLFVAALGILPAACSHQPQLAPPPRFYLANPAGSESEFNPATELLNEGFDILRSNSQDRHVFRRQYGLAAGNVWRSLVHADRTFRFYGYRNALR